MPEVKTPLLSIIVISHNQKEELRRCLDSILAQDIPFEHEIIVSDDASMDGTWELILEYERQYPEILKGFQCNSNDCNPANNSQRSGWNRCNAYPHARGKYIAHVDGDDYFRDGADVYKRQVEMLEKHPECSLCMSNIWEVTEGYDLSEGHAWHKDEVVLEGRIIDADTFIGEHMFILNQAFIQRRNPDVDPVALYGKRYVDSVITYHHLQYGPIVCVDACDYIYVHQEKSVTGQMVQTRDTDVIWCLGLYIPALIPRWLHEYYIADYSAIRRVVCMALEGYNLQDRNKRSLDGLGIFIYDVFNRRLRPSDKARLWVALIYLRVTHRLGLHSEIITDIEHYLLCS